VTNKGCGGNTAVTFARNVLAHENESFFLTTGGQRRMDSVLKEPSDLFMLDLMLPKVNGL
jgi:DNA-binding response OmpR family regulator